MQNVLQKFLQKQISDKRNRLRFMAILLILSICVSTEVFWSLRQTGIALAGSAHCGLIEHTHSSDCYESCTIQEHTHSVSCYSDESADVETKAMWELSLCGVPYSDDFAADLLEVAHTQLGYTESDANFSVDAGGNRNGYTRYGAWYGNPYGQWTAMFVSFCLYYTGVPIGVIPMHAGAESMRVAWEDINMYEVSLEHTVQIGDLVFLDSDVDGSAEHVAIVSQVHDTSVTVIVGDMNDKVEEVTYLPDDSAIMGYVSSARIPEYMKQQNISRVERSVALPVALNEELVLLTSDSQIINYGGANVANDGTRVSKTIKGTGIENIFDITLTVETQQKIEKVYTEPDMAVVIVMDISNTMNDTFGNTDRYSAAMEAAADFINHFAETSGEVSKIGYVAFNTSAHKIFDLQTCNTQNKADALIKKMENETDEIIHATGYKTSNTRYTNVEAGLKMGWDMIKNTHQEHKYIIFLSDGFPTTYLKNHNGTDYIGYDPISGSGTPGKDGVFYDAVWKNYLNAGSSYSDKAAIYARQMATGIKNAGGTIFSIGIDIGGQTINGHLYDENGNRRYPVVDRTGTTYEIGSATSVDSYRNWLKNSIGSGYYYDSTDTKGLKDAYEAIFTEIQHMREEESKAEWIACDPMPILEDPAFKAVEFIGFYNKDKTFIPLTTSAGLLGSHTVGDENTATFVTAADEIDWDLKNSGFTSTTVNNITTYKYQLVYRVRLRNEDSAFVENKEYNTNDTTSLSYRIIETVNGEVQVSENKVLYFPIPSVKGYLGEFSFKKVDPHGGAVVGAEFTLRHDIDNCKICHGDGTSVTTVPDYVAVSDENGAVAFSNIPSGHRYTMIETGIPSGYLDTGRKYWATVSYDVTTVNVASNAGTVIEWDETVLNLLPYDLPGTGGTGTKLFTVIGLTLIAIPLLYFAVEYGKRRLGGSKS